MISLLKRIMIATLLLVGLSAPAAYADTVSDFISVYQDIEKYVPPGSSLPISSGQLISAQSLFRCVDGGTNVFVCIDDFSKTDSGKQMMKESELPSSVWSVLHAYAEYKKDNVWGVVYYLGEAVACAVVQVLTGGADICGLIQELINMGKAIWDAAVAAYEWFKDVGEAILGGLESAGCAVGICCCDDPPPPPPEWQVLYAGYFAPRLAEGLAAHKANYYGGLSLVIQKIKNDTHNKFSNQSFATASAEFKKAVDGAWTAEVVPNGLNQINAKRVAYNTPQQVAQVAVTVVNKAKPDQEVTSRCYNDFSGFGFGHFEFWVMSHAELAKKFAAEGNSSWCRKKFFEGNQALFAQQFKQYLQTHGCTLVNNRLFCLTLENYQRCLTLMGSVNNQAICAANTSTVGKEAANQLVQNMVERGSNQQLYPCTVKAAPGPISLIPAQLICTRPAQTSHCNAINTELFGKLPQTLAVCQLQESFEYKTLREAVTAAHQQLRSRHMLIPITPSKFDPLIASVETSDSVSILQQDPINRTFSFPKPSTQNGFDYKVAFGPASSLDGTNTPQIIYQMPKPDFKKPEAAQHPKDKLTKPGDPRTNPDPTQNLQQGLAVNPALNSGTMSQAVQAQVGSAALQGGQQGQQKVMSGSLPPGSQPGGATGQRNLNTTPAAAPQMSAKPLAKPDLVVAQQLQINGLNATWGSSIALNCQQLQPAGNGLCKASITYTIQNSGAASAAAFSSILSGSTAQPQQWAGIGPKTSQTRTEQVVLRPGLNSLTLHLDQAGQLDELSKTNNQARLQVMLNGTCQPQYQRDQPQQPLQQQPYQRTLP